MADLTTSIAGWTTAKTDAVPGNESPGVLSSQSVTVPSGTPGAFFDAPLSGSLIAGSVTISGYTEVLANPASTTEFRVYPKYSVVRFMIDASPRTVTVGYYKNGDMARAADVQAMADRIAEASSEKAAEATIITGTISLNDVLDEITFTGVQIVVRRPGASRTLWTIPTTTVDMSVAAVGDAIYAILSDGSSATLTNSAAATVGKMAAVVLYKAQKPYGAYNGMALPGGAGFLDIENTYRFPLDPVQGVQTAVNGIVRGTSAAVPVAVSYSPSTRIVTLTPAGSFFEYFCSGRRYRRTAAVTFDAHANTAGVYYMYFGADGEPAVSSTVFNLRENAPVAWVYYVDSTHGWCIQETHWAERDVEWHISQHNTMGTLAVNAGFVLAGYTLNSANDDHTDFTLSGGTIFDEDIQHTITGIAAEGSYNVAYKLGTGVWDVTAASAMPFKYNGGTNWIQYNNAGTLTSLSNNQYVNYWLMCVPTTGGGTIFSCAGTSVHSTLGAAQAESPAAYDFAPLGSQESVVLYQLTYIAESGNSNLGKCKLAAVTRLYITKGGVSSGAATSVAYTSVTSIPQDNLLGRSTASTGNAELIPCGTFSRSLLAQVDAANWRSTLGLGSIATQASNNVSLTGGTISGMTSIAGTNITASSAVYSSAFMSGTSQHVNLRPTTSGYYAQMLNSVGSVVAQVTDTGLGRFGAGSKSAPSVSFYGDTDTGFIYDATYKIGEVIDGVIIGNERRVDRGGSYGFDLEMTRYQTGGLYGPWLRYIVCATPTSTENPRPAILFVRGRGTLGDFATGTSIAPVVAGDNLGSIAFNGYHTAASTANHQAFGIYGIAGDYGDAAGTALSATTYRGHAKIYSVRGVGGTATNILVASIGTGTGTSGIFLGVDPSCELLFGGAAANKVGFYGAAPVAQQTVLKGNTDGEIGGLTISASYTQSEVQALRDKCEELADDLRSLRAAFITRGDIA